MFFFLCRRMVCIPLFVHMFAHVCLCYSISHFWSICFFPYAYILYSFQHSYPFLSEILYMFLSVVLCVDVRIKNCPLCSPAVQYISVRSAMVFLRSNMLAVLYVPAHSPIYTCPQYILYCPVRCPIFFRPLSYIFLFAVYIPVRCPIHIFQSAVLYFSVHFPSFSRPLSYILPSAILHFPVRCPLTSRPLSFTFVSAILYVPIRRSVFSYSLSYIHRSYLRSYMCLPHSYMLLYCPRSYKFLK
jgi:hypothetical protein